MGIWSDLKVLYHLNLKSIRGDTHAERLECFYSSQADIYDNYRDKLLPGRQELWRRLGVPEGGTWIDMGGGTASNLEFFGERIRQLEKVYVVDLCPSLLEVARRRVERFQWNNVELIEKDALLCELPESAADVVTFSYSLTMIPDWYAALERAHRLLRPAGRVGVVDFYCSRKHPPEGMARHSWLTRTFWPCLLSRDNVTLSGDHLPFLHRHFAAQSVQEGVAKVPYIFLLRIPYYIFVGEKRDPSARRDP